MNTVKKQLISGSIAIASILCTELLANTFAVAVTPLRDPVLSQGLRSDDSAAWSRSYDCGQGQVTLTEQGRGRYNYEGV